MIKKKNENESRASLTTPLERHAASVDRLPYIRQTPGNRNRPIVNVNAEKNIV